MNSTRGESVSGPVLGKEVGIRLQVAGQVGADVQIKGVAVGFGVTMVVGPSVLVGVGVTVGVGPLVGVGVGPAVGVGVGVGELLGMLKLIESCLELPEISLALTRTVSV